jgi:hypothetical protein
MKKITSGRRKALEGKEGEVNGSVLFGYKAGEA